MTGGSFTLQNQIMIPPIHGHPRTLSFVKYSIIVRDSTILYYIQAILFKILRRTLSAPGDFIC